MLWCVDLKVAACLMWLLCGGGGSIVTAMQNKMLTQIFYAGILNETITLQDMKY